MIYDKKKIEHFLESFVLQESSIMLVVVGKILIK